MLFNIIRNIGRRALPIRIKKVFEPIVTTYDRRVFQNKLRTSPFALTQGKAKLNYGNVIPKGPGVIVSGGRVKLLSLNEVYPESGQRFNILYLVSSALPPFAVELADWAISKGVKIVMNQNGVAYPAWADSFSQDKYNTPMKAIIQKSNYVFYQSEFCRESADKYLGAVDCPWEIAYNYVDTGVFTPPEKNQSFGEWRLLCAGNNLRRYRVTSALDTVAELKKRGCKVHITIAGGLLWPGSDDPYKDIMEYMKLLGIEREAKIQLTYTREEASDIYSNAHLLLHTKYNDPCPNVVIEAMSCGLPVVGSNSGGMPELVAPGAGILVDVPMDWEKDHAPEVTQLADAVEKIMNQRDRYSQNARELAIRRFDKAIWLNQHKRVFEDILNVD